MKKSELIEKLAHIAEHAKHAADPREPAGQIAALLVEALTEIEKMRPAYEAHVARVEKLLAQAEAKTTTAKKK